MTSEQHREARIASCGRRNRRRESPLTEFEESDETLFASEQTGASGAQASDASHSGSSEETDSESGEGEPLPLEEDDEEEDGDDEREDPEDDESDDDDDARRERLRKMKSRQTFNDDQQNVAIAGAVAGAITVGIVLFVLDYFELW